MKILWVNTNFMHPTTKGGQIRTLEMMRCLHRRHDIHYAAIENPAEPEGPRRAHEYSSHAYPFKHEFPDKRSIGFAWQVLSSVFDSTPIGITRFTVPALGRFLEDLNRKEKFDRAVCDFLTPAGYFPRMDRAVLFQHNVETQVRERYAEHAANPLARYYFGLQADRMRRFETEICRLAGHVVAVSEPDAEQFRQMGATRVTAIPTGVDIDYFTPKEAKAPSTDMAFVGSMDWLPNVDGMTWFVNEVLPLIRERRPEASVSIIGRTPPASISAMAERDPKIKVTGTVPDVRPYLWDSAISIVPLRIGGGTRLKIYESMAARVPIVSTAIGAEGLDINPPADIRIADTPRDFADQCLELLGDPAARARQAKAAWTMVSENFSWEQVSLAFERILEASPSYN
ncbi:MAG: glycosyltransferase family 4 protein [Bryobacteraceae bacterium]|nr:glycosyltransferase family 4 protein [Bryobacteraceae bacterium]